MPHSPGTSSRRPLLALLALAASLTIPATTPASPQVIRLNSDLPTDAGIGGGDVSFELGSPDGSRVVLRSDLLTPGDPGLFSVRIDDPTSLVELFGGLARTELITPDSTRLVVHALSDLWSIPIDGGIAQKLNGSTTVEQLFLTSNDRAVFGSATKLFSVPVDGSSPPLQLVDLGPGIRVLAASYTSAGGRIVFHATDGHLQAVPIDGSRAAVQLDDRPVLSFKLHPSGVRAVYRVRAADPQRGELWSARIDDGVPPVLLSRGASTDSLWQAFELTPDGKRVVFSAYAPSSMREEFCVVPINGATDPLVLTVAGPSISPGSIKLDSATLYYTTAGSPVYLYRVPLDGLTPPRLLRSYLSRVLGLSPDGAWIVYAKGESTRRALYAMPVAGGAAIRLSPPETTGAADTSLVLFTSDRVVFRLDLAPQYSSYDLYSTSLTNGRPPKRLNPGGRVGLFWVGQDDSVVFTSDFALAGMWQAYAVPADGSAPPLFLTPDFVAGPPVGDVKSFAVVPGGSRAVYLADQEVVQHDELYSVTLSDPPVRTSISTATSEPVKSYLLSADGGRIVYIGGPTPEGAFVAPADGSGVPLLLSESGVGYAVFDFQLVPDGARVVYRVRSPVDRLFVATLDGSTPPLPLPGIAGVEVDEYQVSADCEHVVFYAEARGDVYSQRLDGLVGPVQIDDVGRVVQGSLFPPKHFHLSPDGSRAYFVTEFFGEISLSSRAIDGSGTHLRLVSLTSPQEFSEYGVSPDGAWIVYRADAEVENRVELYSVPSGGGPAVKLHPTRPLGHDVAKFRFTPDSSQVLFVSDLVIDDVQELHSVPVDGSGPPRKINAPILSGSGLSYFLPGMVEFDSRTGRVVYAANVVSGEGLVLMSVPLAGNGPARVLSRHAVGGFQMEQSTVFYDGPDVYRVPVEGLIPPQRVNAPLVPRGGVRQKDVTSGPVVYLADQEADERYELFLQQLGQPPGHVQPR